MAKRLEFDIVTDATKGIAGLKQFSSAAKKAMRDVDDSLDGTTTSAQKVAKALSGLAGDLESEMKGAAKAADSLSQALGPELAGRADLRSVVADLHKMGLTFDEITNDAEALAVALRDLDNVQQIKIEADDQATDDLRRTKRAADDLDGEQVDIDIKAEGLDQVLDKLGDLPGPLGAISSVIGSAGLAGAAGAAGVALVGAANAAADMAVEAKVTADLTGSTVENASRLQAVWSGTGADVNDLNDVLLQMNGVLTSTPEIAAQLGINLNDGKDIVERFLEVVKKIDTSMLGPAEKAQLMSQAFGEEGVRQVQRMTTLFGDIETAMAHVSSGRVMSDEDVAAAVEMKAQFAEMSLALQGVVAQLGQDVVPLLADAAKLAGQIKGIADGVSDIPVIGDVWRNFVPGVGTAQAAMDQFHSVWDKLFGDGEVKASLNLEEPVVDSTVAMAALNVQLGKILDKKDPMRRFTSQWNTLIDDLADGTIDTKAAGDAVAFLAKQLGITPDEVISLALGKINDKAAETKKEFGDLAKALTDWAVKAEEDFQSVVVATLDAQRALDDMAEPFNAMARREGAIKSIFDLGNAPLDALKATQDINDAIRDLGTFIREEGVPNIFNANDVDATDFLSKIDSLRGPIQAKVAESFAGVGPEAAKATADAYVTQITKSLKGRLTKDQVRTLLGLDDIEAKIKVAVDQDSLATATAMLELVAGVPGADPLWVAQIRMDLDAAKITPDAVKVLVADKAKGAGLNVPTALLPPSGQSMTAARQSANDFYTRNPAVVATTAGTPSGVGKVLNDTQHVLDQHPLQVGIVATISQIANRLFHDAGGITGPGGGIVGERRPEIVNGRYLVTQPTVVPPGTRVTSGARTARILRHGGRSFKRYDSGGVVAGPQTVNINVTGGVIGNRYDVARGVRKAIYDNRRLLGTRG